MAAIITPAVTEADFDDAKLLFQEYAAALDIDLSFQNFGLELENLREMYGPPRGALLLARSNHDLAGCVALRPFQPDVCEMKRLYVRPAARGQHVGRSLATAVIDAAKALGYKRMMLDTLASMQPAHALYKSLGFRDSTPYYPNVVDGVTYMELTL